MKIDGLRDPFLLGKLAGGVAQGLAIGILLLYIVLSVVGDQSAQVLFRYEGF